MFEKDKKLTKAPITRKKIFDVAMDLIAKDGFDSTTMRGIASKAKVAAGAIYYHFDSKESLIHEYYKMSHADHLLAIGDYLNREPSFEKRLHRIVTSKIETALPYQSMARALFRVAGNPENPLSPFSEQSKELRLESLQLFKEVVNGSKDKIQPELIPILPAYLWLYQMGIILFWIHDNSPKAQKTFALIDQTVPLIHSLNNTLRSPLAAPFRKKIILILKNFEPTLGDKETL